ncbi:PorT family protein [Flavobacterium agricola]|uniref:PorT family protein n=1 Tax=Flavobacterium agricola TaxID=2870839 RepID=A0ABY6M196_9FLAO|nr:porin family protein [Flavobacterium agricola]UYW01485.1 PorT family protein [Flavobacterium agricola]
MKKHILSVVAALAVCAGAQAQTSVDDFKFGFKGGYNLSNLGGDIPGHKALSGFHVGGFAEIPVSAKFAVQPEVLYSAQGSKSKTTIGNVDFKTDVKADFINVPILAKYYALEGLSVEAGPQIGFLVKAKQGSVDVKDAFKSVDFGLAVGASYYFTENIFASARYNFGLTDVAKHSSDGFKMHNNVFQVAVGYRF